MKRLIGLTVASAMMAAVPAAAQQFPTGLQGVKVAVEDYERATRFYEILGMTAGDKYNALEWQLRWQEPADGPPIIMVRDPDGRIKVPKGGAFLMISVPDIKATAARLREAGFAVEGEPHALPQATIMMIKDPDGNTIELLAPPAPAAGPAPGPSPAAAGHDHDHGHDH